MPPASLAIVHAKVVTMDAERRVYDDGTVIIDGGDIVAIGRPGWSAATPWRRPWTRAATSPCPA
ncbi:hypothetical protein HH297_02810 [Xanthomonas sp. Kuri4-3]